MKQYLSQQTLLKCIAFLLAIHMVNFPFVCYPDVVNHGPSWYGLDVSWQMTLNYAKVSKWVWGKDIIYTYGPLGYLATRMGWGISKWVFLLFDIFIVFNLYHIFKDFLRIAADKLIAIILLVMVSLTVEPGYGSDLSWAVMMFSFYWMYKSFNEPKYIYFIMACLQIILCFYIKLNAGLVGIVILGGHLLNLLIFKKIKLLKAVIVICGLSAAILITSIILHVSLPAYFKGAVEIIKGYNDIMYLEMDTTTWLEVNVTLLFYGFVIFYGISAIALVVRKDYQRLYYVCIAMLYTFLLRKQSILRNDEIHYFEFFSYSTLIFLPAYFIDMFDKKQKPVIAGVLVLSIVSLSYTSQRPMRSINDAAMRRYANQREYVTNFFNYNNPPFLNNRHKRYIPGRVLDSIGKKTVDIFPWDTEYLLENGLNYKPRPVFQSFSAYTNYLAQANYDSYEKNAPEYVIYDYESIDGRYPYNDDILVNYFIYKNYTFADSFTSNDRWRTLLKKKPVTAPIELVVPKEATGEINKEIPVDWVMMLRMDLKYNLAGKLQSFFYRAPLVTLKMKRNNGHWVSYKVSAELLKAGVMVDRWVISNSDYVKYMQNKNLLDYISAVEIKVDPNYFEKKIKVKYINVK
ncbi:MAG: hypothetical protein JST82_15890 [Bacteroidetes bacterium]|nr:hypothetical protein [Bacteroidota bacterium]